MAMEPETSGIIESGGEGGIIRERIEARGDIEGITREKEDTDIDRARNHGHDRLHATAVGDRTVRTTDERHDRLETSTRAIEGTATGTPGEVGLQTEDIGIERQISHESCSVVLAMALGSHAAAFVCNALRSAFIYMACTPG